jgi:hypothetical protein
MHSWPQRLSVFAAALLLASAVCVVVGVIPPVRTDTFSLAAPQRAVPAFWVAVVLDIVLAAAAVASSRLGYRVLLAVVAVVTVLAGYALFDAATAFRAHGPAMHGAVVVLWVCVGFDVVGALSMLGAVLAPRHQWGDRLSPV